MLILLDFSQIVFSSALDYFYQTKSQMTLELTRHIVLRNIISFKKKFRGENSDIVICCDGKNYWRKTVFPFYKQNREKTRTKDSFDWETFYTYFNQIKHELTNDLPFKIIEVEGCEADDVIAVLTKFQYPHQDKIFIVSSDKDFIQLQKKYPKIKQWSPKVKKYINEQTNQYNLIEHIVKGDSGDGIPNILSDDDVFITEKRSKSVYKKDLEQWKMKEPEEYCSEKMLERFYRNKRLIDLNEIPQQQVELIIETFNSLPIKKVYVFNYLVRHKITKIMESGEL